MSHRRYDVYDDTGRRSHRSQREMMRRDERFRDPMFDMMERMDRDFMGFHNSMLSSMMGAMQGAFRDATNDGSSTYYYESHSRRMDPDGRIREEHVRSNPGRDGRPTTERIVRNPDGTHEQIRYHDREPPNPFALLDDFRTDFGWPSFDNQRQLLPPAQVEELSDDEREPRRESRRESRRRRSRSERSQQPIVEEPDDEAMQEEPQERKSFYERARRWPNWG